MTSPFDGVGMVIAVHILFVVVSGLMAHRTFGEVGNSVSMGHQRALVLWEIAEYESKYSDSGEVIDHACRQPPVACDQSENRGLRCFRCFPPT